MKQFKIVKAYEITEELSQNTDLSIKAKWALYKLRKDLLPHREFYLEESKKLFSQYKTTVEGNTITFESPELAKEYQHKQDEIDSFEIDASFSKPTLNLSDIPSITISQIEQLDDFILFIPE